MADTDRAESSPPAGGARAGEQREESGKWRQPGEVRKGPAAATSAFRVTGVRRQTAEDIRLTVEATTPANARVKAEMLGIVVTDVAPVSGGRSPAPRRDPAAVAWGEQDPGADLDEAASPAPLGFSAAKWSSWPKVLGAVSLGWGATWILGGVVGFTVGFTAGGVFLHWSSDLVDLLICGFMVLYGSLAIKAGYRLSKRLHSSIFLGKFVWGIAFLMGLAYLFWPRVWTPGGVAVTVVLLVMSLAYPIFLFLWLSDSSIKAQVRSWPRGEEGETDEA